MNSAAHRRWLGHDRVGSRWSVTERAVGAACAVVAAPALDENSGLETPMRPNQSRTTLAVNSPPLSDRMWSGGQPPIGFYGGAPAKSPIRCEMRSKILIAPPLRYRD